MPEWRKLSDEVYYTDGGVTLVDREGIEFLKVEAGRSPRQRCRLCCHKDPSAPLHDMIIVMSANAYIRPHRHLDKDESLHLIEGSGLLCVFGDDGELDDVRRLGGVGSGANFFYRMPAGVYHTQLIATDWLVFHESASGPFDPARMQDAPWTPAEDDANAVGSYLGALWDRAKAFG